MPRKKQKVVEQPSQPADEAADDLAEDFEEFQADAASEAGLFKPKVGQAPVDGASIGPEPVKSGDVLIRQPTLIAAPDIVCNDWNANEEKDDKFAALLQEIETKGFKDPITVAPLEGQPGKYRIIGGEHRFRAGRALRMTHFPAYIDTEMPEEDDQIIATFRLNNLHGEINPKKAAKAIARLSGKHADDELVRQMALQDEKELARWRSALNDEDRSDRTARDVLAGDKNKEALTKRVVQEMGELLQDALNSDDVGENAEHNVLLFGHKGNTHCAVRMTSGLLREVELMNKLLLLHDMDANEFLTEAIRAHREVVEKRMN